MSEPDLVDRFTRDVDNLLSEGDVMDVEPALREYRHALELARALSAVDFSDASRVRAPLRRELLSRIDAGTVRRHVPPSPSLPFRLSRLAVSIAAALVIAAAFLTLTPAGQAVATRAGDVVREFLWPNLSVQQVESGDAPEDAAERIARFKRELAAGRAWELEFEGYSFGGCCAEGMRDEVLSLQAAVAQVGFPLQLPGYLPAGFHLVEVRLLGVAPYDVFLLYEGPGARLGLYQSFVGYESEQRMGDNVTVLTSRKSSIVTEAQVDRVRVGEERAAHIAGEALVWEQGGVSVTLIGPGLGLETLIQVGESLSSGP